VCAFHYAQLSYTIGLQYRTFPTIFPLILLRITIAQVLTVGGKREHLTLEL